MPRKVDGGGPPKAHPNPGRTFGKLSSYFRTGQRSREEGEKRSLTTYKRKPAPKIAKTTRGTPFKGRRKAG